MNDIAIIRNIIPNGAKVDGRATSNNGMHIHLPNGYKVSIQWGPGTYSDNHDSENLWNGNFYDALKSTTAEVAVINPDGQLIETPFTNGDTVVGWQSPEQVMTIIEWAMTLGDKINGGEKSNEIDG